MYYSYCSCPVGIVEISASDTGLESIDFVKEADQNKQSNHITESVKIQIDQYFAGTRMAFDIEIEFRGTDFQKKVWHKLLEIPYGQTLSYGEMAKRLDIPNAVRAVANANGANAISIFVPCHRVIGSDRSLTGYGGGLTAKKYLLEMESIATAGIFASSL